MVILREKVGESLLVLQVESDKLVLGIHTDVCDDGVTWGGDDVTVAS